MIKGAVARKLWFTWLIITGSFELKDKKKKKSQVNPKKITGNINKINTELVLFLFIWLCNPKYLIRSELYFRRLLCSCALITKFKHQFALKVK